MPPPRKAVDLSWADSMHEITRTAQEAFAALAALQDEGKPDCHLAWVTGLRQEHPWAELTRTAINAARVAGLSWREIAVITEGDGSSADRVERKQAWRNESFELYNLGSPGS